MKRRDTVKFVGLDLQCSSTSLINQMTVLHLLMRYYSVCSSGKLQSYKTEAKSEVNLVNNEHFYTDVSIYIPAQKEERR